MEIKIYKLELKEIKKFLLDIFFPSFCAGCKKEGSFLCSECEEKIEIKETPSHLPLKTKIEKIYCATEYRQDIVKDLIYDYKYKFIKEIKNELSRLIIKHLEKTGFEKKGNYLIIPVPLHKKRLRWRGFNQSELLAKKIGEHFKIPMENRALTRIKYTAPQALQENKEERLKNLKGAFECKNSKILENKHIILVDDIATTGSTIKECAKTLLANGAAKISVVVVAK